MKREIPEFEVDVTDETSAFAITGRTSSSLHVGCFICSNLNQSSILIPIVFVVRFGFVTKSIRISICVGDCVLVQLREVRAWMACEELRRVSATASDQADTARSVVTYSCFFLSRPTTLRWKGR